MDCVRGIASLPVGDEPTEEVYLVPDTGSPGVEHLMKHPIKGRACKKFHHFMNKEYRHLHTLKFMKLCGALMSLYIKLQWLEVGVRGVLGRSVVFNA